MSCRNKVQVNTGHYGKVFAIIQRYRVTGLLPVIDGIEGKFPESFVMPGLGVV